MTGFYSVDSKPVLSLRIKYRIKDLQTSFLSLLFSFYRTINFSPPFEWNSTLFTGNKRKWNGAEIRATLMRPKGRGLSHARARTLRNRIETIMSGLAKRGPLECRSFQRIIISREYTRHYRYSGFDEYCMETVRAARRCLALANHRDTRQILIFRNTWLSSLPRASSYGLFYDLSWTKSII